ncbi:ATP-binding protein [Desulfotruncus alcoholivorax]|uniref:ATP-binding protein n=1 Tax=Desulfotruncus alcoholivorax TaxID=265477 RepID=UPI00040BA404|nr:ATP-binding protein [Desulfotruncus alcoholivorax]
MPVKFQRAQRKKARLRLAIAGPAGSGKTYSALLIAFGLGDRIALIDTERGSGELYAHLGEYDVCTLEAPFTPEKYVEAIRAAESAGYQIIIIDSLSHAWAGPGGVLDIHGHTADKSGNSWTAWRQVTPRHNELVDAMLLSRCHIIATLRSKMEHVQTSENGKTVIKKVGMNPIQRDGLEYEFTVFWDLDNSHTASASKDRTGLFDGQVFKPALEVGGKLLEWLESGTETQPRSGRQPNLVVVGGGQAEAGRAAASTPENNAGFDAANGGGNPAGCEPGAPGNLPGQGQPATKQQKVMAEKWYPPENNWEASLDNTVPPPSASNRPAHPPANGSQAPATQAQLRKIFITAGEAGLAETMLSQLIEQETGKASVKDLTKPEASRVIDVLLGMAGGIQNPKPETAVPPPRAAGGSRMRLF